jgi:hypothetical protein
VPRAFSRVVEQHREDIALTDASHEVTYSELDDRSNAIAGALSRCELAAPVVGVDGA